MEQGVIWWGGLAALGLGVGVIAGMFGVGGGFLLTPLLALLFGVPTEIAVGTGLCQMIGVALAALIRHLRLGQGEIKVDWIMLAGSLLGVTLGARTVTALSEQGTVTVSSHPISAARLAISLSYIALLGGVAAWMLRDAQQQRRRPSSEGEEASLPGPLTRLRLPPVTYLPRCGYRVSTLLLSYLGLAMGFLSGLLGIGGGVALMPLLIYGIGMPIRIAAGTGILVLLVTSLFGTLIHARLGHVHLGMAMMLLMGSTLGAQIGATLTAHLAARRLRGLFACLVLLTSAAVAWDLARKLLFG